MARTVTPLTDPKCEAAKPRDKDYTLFDGQGLFLLVKPSGVKTWRLKFVRPDGREGLATFGCYPALGLKAARDRRADAGLGHRRFCRTNRQRVRPPWIPALLRAKYGAERRAAGFHCERHSLLYSPPVVNARTSRLHPHPNAVEEKNAVHRFAGYARAVCSD